MSSIISRLCLLVFVGVILSSASSAQAQIVGGAKSAQGELPFFCGFVLQTRKITGFTSLWSGNLRQGHTAHCGSLLNNPDHPEFYAVYMGFNSWTQPRDIQYMFKVREIIRHPDYHNFFKDNDIALIFLDRSIDFNGINRNVQCVNDPEPLDNLDTSKCVTMGWGKVNTLKRAINLMEVVLPILNNKICSKKSVNFDADHHLCAGYVDSTFPTGTCKGDSGGPLVCPQKANPEKYSLVGIASFGTNPPNCGRKPSYFTNVERFEDWIASVYPKTRNVQKPAVMADWADFKKGWFGRLSILQ